VWTCGGDIAVLQVCFRLSTYALVAKTQPDKVVRWCPDDDFFGEFSWLPCVADADIIFLPCGFFLLSSFFYSSPNLSGRRLDVYHISITWCGLSANLECRSEMCCTRLAGNTGRKIVAKNCHPTTLSGYIFATKARIDNLKKNWLSSNISTRPYNMVNFGPLAAEIASLV